MVWSQPRRGDLVFILRGKMGVVLVALFAIGCGQRQVYPVHGRVVDAAGNPITELKGAVHAPAPQRKKSELVELLAKLFADAADGTLEDKKLAEKLNSWLPANLR